MWFLLLLTHVLVGIEPVNLQGKGRAILRNDADRSKACEGVVEVYYDGKPGYVGDKSWNRSVEDVVCNITQCGTAVRSEDEYRYKDHTVWLNELKCGGTEESLWDCPGWPAPGLSFYLKPTVKKITCSNDVKLSLNKHKCAGAVKYSINNKERGYICEDSWGPKEAEVLCNSLGCGGFREFPNHEWMLEDDFDQSDKMKINCSGIDAVDHLWQCATEKPSTCKQPAAVVCRAHQKVRLRGNKANLCSGFLEYEEDGMWKSHNNSDKDKAETCCQQMHCGGLSAAPPSITNSSQSSQITCRDNVQVVLMDRGMESKCFGSVNIRVNGAAKPVCATTWTDVEAETVCAELNCGKMVSNSQRGARSGIMDYVKCNGSESSLWQCNAKHGNNIACKTSPYVVCADSMDVKLVDGPGRCAGRLEVFYEGQWKRVDKTKSRKYSDLVCKQLNCGTTRTGPEHLTKFHQGSGSFLTLNCKTKSQHISNCMQRTGNSEQAAAEAVGITCEEHELVFLKGNKSCSGAVMIEQGNHNYWLSGSNATWNQQTANTVCQQMFCGSASSYKSERSDNETEDVWQKSYNCTSTKTSLFECDNVTSLPSEHNQTFAYVECSGKISMNLSHNCWGSVKVCAEGKCGGVCADTWTDERSEELCSSLGCGDKALPAPRQPGTSDILFMSMHATSHTTELSQSCFVKMEGKSCTPAYVACAGSIKPRFASARDKCSGNVEVFYQGRWLPVSTAALEDINTKNTICKELKCGTAVEKSVPYFGPTSKVDQVVADLQCSSADASLAACDITVSPRQNNRMSLTGLRCSEWRTIALEVQDTCTGDVVVYSKESRSLMSSQNWTDQEGQRLCQDMTCGTFKSKQEPERKRYGPPLWNKTFSCPAGKLESVWDCETETPAPSQNQKLRIECEGESKVTLSDTCGGVVRINNMEICAQNWNMEYANRVCQEMNCGNAIVDSIQSKYTKAISGKKYLHVSCDEHHYRLGQCKRAEGECDTTLASIFCFGNVKFNTTEKCGGVIKVNYRNEDETVCPETFPDSLKNMLCEKINCTSSIDFSKQASPWKKAPTLSLACPPDYNDVRYCVKPKTCTVNRPSTIYCKGYEIKTDPPEPEPTSATAVIVGVGLLLVVVILIVIFLRYYLGRRRNKRRLPPGMLPGKDIEFESGEYEDVDGSDERGELSHGRFRAEAEFRKEEDVQSTSSFPYDDIDQVAESQPLAPHGSTAAPPRDGNLHGGVPNQNGGNYEVEESQENYDDIDACPEVSQTTAEVHDGPRTKAETDAAGPPDPEQKDEDYLVPGQDG